MPDWNGTHWTSRSRVEAGHTPFVGKEKDYADFTYPDTTGSLTQILCTRGWDRAEHWLENFSSITYHLEVKATTEKLEEPFYMSNNQIDKVQNP